MADLVLATVNARFAHSSFGLRYLQANLGPLASVSTMLEFELRQSAEQIVQRILDEHPRVIGLGVYIWNARISEAIVALLKQQRPDCTIVLGGPEVSFEVEQQRICQQADYVCTGEADLTFPALISRLLAGDKPSEKIIPGPPVDVRRLALPYDEYTDRDIAQRVIYVEASRGCPFTCEFCLSSLDVPVRRFELSRLLPAFERLMERGVRQFKFVDRTFNLSIAYSVQLMEFFLKHYREGLFLHFEMIPDRLPIELRDLIRAFPAKALQFEVGIQTFNEDVAARIRRRQDYRMTEDNIRFLIGETTAHIHADLIYGLPGESLESFAAGFDRLVGLGPQEIQVNKLKRLRGTPIVRHDREWGMIWDPEPPYGLIRNRLLDESTLDRLDAFARFWNRIVNNGDFIESAPMMWTNGSPFAAFMSLSDRLRMRFGRSHAIPLEELARAVFEALVPTLGSRAASEVVGRDYQRGARRDLPGFLRAHLPEWPRFASEVAAALPGLER